MRDESEAMREDLRFDALNSALYHTDRRGFYERLEGLSNLIVLIFSSGSVVAFAQNHPLVGTVIGFAVTVCGGLSLVFAPARKSCHEAVLCSRAYAVGAEAETAKTIDEMHSIRARLNLLYGDELPTMRAVNAIAFNAAQESLFPEGRRKRLLVGARHSLLRHVLPFHGADFPIVERAAEGEISGSAPDDRGQA